MLGPSPIVTDSSDLVSRDYVFREQKNGKLTLVGDFEGYYRNEKDPWGQRGTDERLRDYYAYSRGRLRETVDSLLPFLRKEARMMEVGCGFGFVLKLLFPLIDGGIALAGLDISPTAIGEAQRLFPAADFYVADITSADFDVPGGYEIVIMGQILWYVLERLPQVFLNVGHLLAEQGYLVFTQGFLSDQRYGKDIIDGFHGLVRYVILRQSERFQVVKADLDPSNRFPLADGLLVLKKRSS